jgi:hypothetical protein
MANLALNHLVASEEEESWLEVEHLDSLEAVLGDRVLGKGHNLEVFALLNSSSHTRHA